MARIRTIKPDFFKNEEVAELPAMFRLLFIGLWTQADREGRLEDRPKRLKAELFPYDNIDVDKGLNELQAKGFIYRYKVNANVPDRILTPEQPVSEVSCIQVINFSKHQRLDKKNENPSQLPEYQSTNSIIENMSIDSLLIAGERKGKEGKGRECIGADAPTQPPSEDFIDFLDFISRSAPQVMKMKEQFTQEQFEKLSKLHPIALIKSKLINMHNKPDLCKKYLSAYVTCLNWCKAK